MAILVLAPSIMNSPGSPATVLLRSKIALIIYQYCWQLAPGFFQDLFYRNLEAILLRLPMTSMERAAKRTLIF
ncbi:hypothetical protein L195_g013797 [Trifolium pratense]|uniref:Uncharacterized protein n=1 Tax=Trifolium pratense TaxID=57577 RepID=A0A2K3MRS4_TRIPR|nr:hypothetical protein L195_g016621 [Trifolium pratense]PNY17062.1 hypothetical protein L195_g013797 [Trifolium pratense]